MSREEHAGRGLIVLLGLARGKADDLHAHTSRFVGNVDVEATPHRRITTAGTHDGHCSFGNGTVCAHLVDRHGKPTRLVVHVRDAQYSLERSVQQTGVDGVSKLFSCRRDEFHQRSVFAHRDAGDRAVCRPVGQTHAFELRVHIVHIDDVGVGGTQRCKVEPLERCPRQDSGVSGRVNNIWLGRGDDRDVSAVADRT